MFWVAFKGYNNGKAISLGSVEQLEAEAYGMHGYPTETKAEANPNSVNALEKAQVNAWIVAANDITGNPVKDVKHAASAAEGAVPGIADIGGFFRDLGSANTWIRLGKVILGAVLITVGVVKLTGADKTIGGIAAKAVKAAPFL